MVLSVAAATLQLHLYLKHIDNTATERGKHMANIPTHCHCHMALHSHHHCATATITC